jgi:hypothetical protein
MKVNSLVSGGLTIGAADLVPAVNWALAGFHGHAPANLSALIAGGIVMALHAAYNYAADRRAAKGKQATPSALPVAALTAISPVQQATPAA